MKKRLRIPTLSIIMLSAFFTGCVKEKSVPNVSTTPILSITDTTVSSGGNVISDGGTAITERGVCWDTLPNPTVINSKTMDGVGIGLYTSEIKIFNPNTTYYLRAFATNSVGTGYGKDITFVTNKTLPIVSTSNATFITSSSASISGNIIHIGGDELISCGLCWGTNQNPTTSSNKIVFYNKYGRFERYLTGLSNYTTYFVRAYAENEIGISYGPQISFRTTTDITAIDYDGNIYNAVTIGTQVWTIENLKVIHYQNGESIKYVTDGMTWSNSGSGAYCFYDNDLANKDIYGAIYNWYAVGDNRRIAPQGWHVATDEEWKVLYRYLGGNKSAAGKMKIYGTNYGSTFNSGANNASNFSAIPSGRRWETSDGQYSSLGSAAYFWCGNQCSNCGNSNSALSIFLYDYCDFYADDKHRGHAVRCVKD